MRIAAILYIIASVTVNFFVDHFSVFILAMFSFPVLLWVLLKKKKTKQPGPAVVRNEKPRPVSQHLPGKSEADQ